MQQIVEKQRAFFSTGKTKQIAVRRVALKRLYAGIKNKEQELLFALKQDLGRSKTESYMAEIGMALSEIHFALENLDTWAKDEPVKTPWYHLPAKSYVQKEPFGVALIMAPWNYPFLLCISPLIGALAAGNCAVVKPSEYAPATAAVVEELIQQCFPAKYVAVVQGGLAVNQRLLEQKFDYIFFTGSTQVGKIVMEKAARHLTPVCLELGGKSPCIVDETANVAVAARRIAFGKFLNAGQTCIAPDYVFVHSSVKDEFLKEMQRSIKKFYGRKPMKNLDFPRVVNHKHFRRLEKMLEGEMVLIGGKTDLESLRIEPTLIMPESLEAPCMQEEIFGPILPLFTYENLEEVIGFVNNGGKPLALYLFTETESVKHKVLAQCSFGGGCVNDTISHIVTSYLPFGGVGNSGMGRYHGKSSFDAFSNHKGILEKTTAFDLSTRYHPYGKVKSAIAKFALD